MIIWGGYHLDAFLGDGSRYSPTAGTWTSMTPTNALTPRGSHTAIWAGSEMIIWGGKNGSGNTGLNDGSCYNPTVDEWRAIPNGLPNTPAGRLHHTAVWTGSEMIVWGGDLNSHGSAFNDGGRYNPSSNTWAMVPTTGAPSPRTEHAAAWTGEEMIVCGGWNLITYYTDTWSYTPGQAMFLYQRP